MDRIELEAELVIAEERFEVLKLESESNEELHVANQTEMEILLYQITDIRNKLDGI